MMKTQISSDKNTILVITSEKDKTADYIENLLENKGIKVYRLNTDLLDTYDISLEFEHNDINIHNDNQGSISLSKVKSIYFRKPSIPIAINHYIPSYHNFIRSEFLTFLLGITKFYNINILTDPFLLKKANNKILQLKIAKSIGFEIPDTIISNSTSKIINFIESKEKVIVKPLSHGRIAKTELVYTSIIERLDTRDLESISISPHIFQEYIEKDFDLRLTVVGQKAFPVKIISNNKIDWRLGKNIYTYTNVPNSLIKSCMEYMRKFNLNFCAFDFIKHNGKFYFLEANPNGQWLWLELKLGIPIAEEIVNLLLKE